MDDHKSISIIMMLALSALLGVITLICWCRELWQERAAIRWATQPLVDSADKGNGLESVQHGLRDADMDLAAATDQAISLSLRQVRAGSPRSHRYWIGRRKTRPERPAAS